MTCAEAIALAPRPILVLAHTEAQVCIFARSHRLAPHEVHRAYGSDHLRGRSPRGTDSIFLLPSWALSMSRRDAQRVDDLLARWKADGGSIFECRESDVVGFGQPGLTGDSPAPPLVGITPHQFNDVFIEGMHNYARRNHGFGPARAYIGRNQSRTLEEIMREFASVSDARLKGTRRTFHNCTIYVVDADDHLEFA